MTTAELRAVALAIALIAAVCALLLSIKQQERHREVEGAESDMQYAYVSGFFQHDRQPTGPEDGFRARTLPGFGILERSYDDLEDKSGETQWQKFEQYLGNRKKIPEHRGYKVLFVARHGEGVHNVKEREVGRSEWERYWSRLDGDGNATWLDASLTSQGVRQAEDLGDFWISAIELDKVPIPDAFYTSPLTRCLQTADATWGRVAFPDSQSFHPMIKEDLRERFGVHTCDQRSSRSKIEKNFPQSQIEDGFSENDELWQPEQRETMEELAGRWRHFTDDLFTTEDTFISVTTHSGAIRALYMATGHPDVWVAAGAAFPIMIEDRR